MLTGNLSACGRTFLLTVDHICLRETISAYMKAYLLGIAAYEGTYLLTGERT